MFSLALLFVRHIALPARGDPLILPMFCNVFTDSFVQLLQTFWILPMFCSFQPTKQASKAKQAQGLFSTGLSMRGNPLPRCYFHRGNVACHATLCLVQQAVIITKVLPSFLPMFKKMNFTYVFFSIIVCAPHGSPSKGGPFDFTLISHHFRRESSVK